MNFSVLQWFGSFIKMLKKGIGLYYYVIYTSVMLHYSTKLINNSKQPPMWLTWKDQITYIILFHYNIKYESHFVSKKKDIFTSMSMKKTTQVSFILP